MYSAEAFIKCTNDKIKRMEASVNHLEDSSKKLAQHNKQLEKQLGVSTIRTSVIPSEDDFRFSTDNTNYRALESNQIFRIKHKQS